MPREKCPVLSGQEWTHPPVRGARDDNAGTVGKSPTEREIMSTQSSTHPSSQHLDAPVAQRTGVLRRGLILAIVLAALDVVTGILAVFGSFFAPPEVGILIIALGVATLVVVPYAWNGRRSPALIAIVVRLLSAATALPAFFVPDVPAAGIVAAAVGILISVLCAYLIASGLRRERV